MKVDGTDVNLSDYKQTFAYGSSMTIAQIGEGQACDAGPDHPDECRAERPRSILVLSSLCRWVTSCGSTRNGIQDPMRSAFRVTVTLDQPLGSGPGP